MVGGCGLRVVEGEGVRVSGFNQPMFSLQASGFRVQGSALGFRVQGSGCRMLDAGVRGKGGASERGFVFSVSGFECRGLPGLRRRAIRHRSYVERGRLQCVAC